MHKVQIKLLILWFWLRFHFNQNRKSCLNCAHGSASATGDRWNEPREYEWGCSYQDKEGQLRVEAFDRFIGEVGFDFATICPKYRNLTPEEQRIQTECY
ncbi:hypothetical protein [Leptolyngbya sp. AN10]|uniref:hypothetical protein n=1 Tax=Leptolyngbya sp. AN10 TaxID=3423365 RepID=UPI003D315A21